MTQLFGRKARVQIGRLIVEKNTIDFEVKTNLRSKPNTAVIRLYNLNESNRDAIDSLGNRGAVQLDAGYLTTDIGTIFIGDISRSGSRWDRGTWITEIEAGDGRSRSRRARINQSHASGTSLGFLIRQAGEALGVGQGNLDQIASRFTQSVPATRTLSGNAARVLDQLTREAGLEWSVQRGNLQFVERRRALAGRAIVLRPGTGLIGSPEVNKDGTVTVKSNIIPDLFPGRQIRVESRKVTGNFRVETAQYRGNTRVGEWNITSVGRDVNA